MSKNWLSEMVQGQEENLRDRRIADADLQQKKLRGKLGYSFMDAQSLWKQPVSDTCSAGCSNACSDLGFEFDDDFGTEIPVEQGRNSGSYSFLDSRVKKKAKEDKPEKKPLKKESKKKRKKRKKHFEAAQEILSEALMENNVKTGSVMAEVMKYATNVVLAEEQIWLYNEDQGCYRPVTPNEMGRVLRSYLPEEDCLKISSRDYREAYNQLLLSEEIQHKDGFFENGPYVNCLSGVVDVLSGELMDPDPGFYFKHCIQAYYQPDGGHCPRFKAYIDHITNGDKELKRLIRVMLGYICSHYCNAKTGFLVYGTPNTGKSVLLNITERILGSDLVSHADLCMLHKQEYVASMWGKLLNVAPDLQNKPLENVGLLKSLLSQDDKISARLLYGNPITIRGEVKMLFASNHLLEFQSTLGPKDIEAIFNRMIYIPYMNAPISKSEEDKHLSEHLYEERDGIFTWAIAGLKDYIQAGEQFPECRVSSELKERNMATYCPEKVFFTQRMKRDPDEAESTTAIKEAFKDFCMEMDQHTVPNIGSFLEEHEGLTKVKKRVKGAENPIYVYLGVRLKDEYRDVINDENEEE